MTDTDNEFICGLRWQLEHASGVTLESDELKTLVDAWDERERLRPALVKIDKIRNSIIGTQQVNWSAHVYPLVAALGEAGFEGESYNLARAKAQTLIEERDALAAKLAEVEKERDRAREDAKRLQGWREIYTDLCDAMGRDVEAGPVETLDRIRSERDAALAKLAEHDNAICWQTSCLNYAKMLDRCVELDPATNPAVPSREAYERVRTERETALAECMRLRQALETIADLGQMSISASHVARRALAEEKP